MTEEEKVKRREIQRAEKQARMNRFPRVDLGGWKDRPFIYLEEGNPNYLSIRYKWDGKEWSNEEILINEPLKLAEFIDGMCRRLQFHLEELNKSIDGINSIRAGSIDQ